MVVIVGGGITGASTAYWLSRNNNNNNNENGSGRITLIDAVGPATCSKAAAFLSESWADGTKMEKLHRASFQLHLQLAQELGLESFCGEIPAFQGVDWEDLVRQDVGVDNDKDDSNNRNNHNSQLWKEFVKNPVQSQSYQKKGRHALVDPHELVISLLKAAQVEVQLGSVEGLEFDPMTGHVSCLQMENGDCHPLDHKEPVVLAMGPWASRLEDWWMTSRQNDANNMSATDTNSQQPSIPIPIDGICSTSLVFETSGSLLFQEPTALFCEEDSYGCHLELYQRYDQSLYVSGLGNSKPIPALQFRSKTTRPIPGQERFARPHMALQSLRQAKFVLQDHDNNHDNNHDNDSHHNDLPFSFRTQACIRPTSPDGLPVVGNVGGNLYIATGGGPWGITWGPLLGKLVAEQICRREPSFPGGKLHPNRFDTVLHRKLLERRNREIIIQQEQQQ